MSGESNGPCVNEVSNRYKLQRHANRFDARAPCLTVHNISRTFPALCDDWAPFRMFFRGLKSDPLP